MLERMEEIKRTTISRRIENLALFRSNKNVLALKLHETRWEFKQTLPSDHSFTCFSLKLYK